MVGRVILEGPVGFVVLLLAIFGVAAVAWFVWSVLSECCLWVWRRLRRGGRQRPCRRSRGALPEVEDCPPMPPVKEPRGRVVRVEVDGRVIDYESAPSEIYEAIAALVIQNTEIMRQARAREKEDKPIDPEFKRERLALVEDNRQYIAALMAMAMAGEGFTTKGTKGKTEG
jgi:hypothetical protein